MLHFGIREHGMGSIMNGIALHGGTRVYGGTFLTFSDYMRGAVRLAALMQLPVTYVWTHDSIGLGEDGPTHQPVEHLTALRAIPGLDVVRPADANETVAAWQAILENATGPAGLVLTRQNVPTYPRGTDGFATTDERRPRRLRPARRRGRRARRDPHRHRLRGAARRPGAQPRWRRRASRPASSRCRAASGSTARSSPTATRCCRPIVKARVSVEAGIAMSWRDLVGSTGRCVSLEHYGASADYQTLYREFGITAEAVTLAAEGSIADSAD